MPVTRSKREEQSEELVVSEQQAEYGETDREEQFSEPGAGLEETLYSVKDILGEIKIDQDELNQSYKRVSEENRDLSRRIERLESHDTAGWINRQINFESRINDLAKEVDHLTASSQSYKEMKSQLETTFGELQSIRSNFTESFEGLLTAVEGLDKELHSAVTDLQVKMTDLSKHCLPETPAAKSTEKKISGQGLLFNGTLGSSQRIEERSLSLQRKPKPVQPAPKFDGKTSWEVFQAQFDIAAEINGWQEEDKAVFLATALEGRAALVLGNLSDKERRNYESLVSALTTRFGMAHQSEFARAKLKCRSKSKEDSMPELAESVEILTRVAYPDASVELQDTIARDNFIDALQDDDMRLKIRQARPKSLQSALENALELESFQMASRQRSRVPRG